MRFFSLILIACLGTFALAPMVRADDSVMNFASDDAAMNTAMSAARAHLPLFLDQAARSDLSQGDFLIKWAYPVNGGNNYEHIWVTVFSLTDTAAIGVLANQPVGFEGSPGDAVTVPLADVSDWSFWDASGKLHGSYTTRVMVPQLSPEVQAYFASVLAPLPE